MLRIVDQALTFDDVLLVPDHSDVLPKDVNLQTRLTKTLNLNIPLLSAAMDTVTESRMGIALSELGGIGIIHKNLSIDNQASEVRKVKKYESGIVRDPITIHSDNEVGDLIQLTKELNISGMPVVDNGELVGIVTSRDFRYEENLTAKVASIMTPKERLVTAKEGESPDVIKKLLQQNRIEKILLIDDSFRLTGLVTLKDINKSLDFPDAARDSEGRLLAGAAIGTKPDTLDRCQSLIDAGVDVLVADSAHGHSEGVLNIIKEIKSNFKDIQIIGGNVATGEGAIALAEAGADAVKVGIGPGSICTTRIVTGVGVPQVTAVAQVTEALKDTDIPIIADGGIRFSGDIAKAIAAGGHTVMLGSVLAGTEEAPGELELYQGRSYKSYRGMGSIGAMSGDQGSSDRYFQDSAEATEKLVPEGIEGRVPYKGWLQAVIHQMIGGLRQSMGYTGSHNIETMRTKPKFVQITSAGVSESHVHDVSVTKEAPNYRIS
ncbi:IMP dehydrogenase [Gammaproteobacteria bacterium]|jgi:IMP dehydrogenase|nr:IMP dehydrogenase [Gammaproteobacteria bacterium]MEC8449070.1 IMP dehydrogenase [Pseudomonadota bacterium]|tara:strand:+ start:791 stop:2260 length:1470 start_codon:yes stop_codon:yes gene_type:complete